MKQLRLHANYFSGEGCLKNVEEFKELDALLRADLLKDWIYDLNKLYEVAVEEAFTRKEKPHESRA